MFSPAVASTPATVTLLTFALLDFGAAVTVTGSHGEKMLVNSSPIADRT